MSVDEGWFHGDLALFRKSFALTHTHTHTYVRARAQYPRKPRVEA